VRVIAAAAGLLLLGACGGQAGPDDAAAHDAIVHGRSGAEVTFDATVVAEPVEAGGHERFFVRDPAGDQLEVDHNTTLAAPVPAHAGDRLVIHGQLYVDRGRDGVHCTHAHTSRGCPEPGWIRLGSQTYQ